MLEQVQNNVLPLVVCAASRRPLDLPSLPLGYLQEVYAHVKLQNPGADFDRAAGALLRPSVVGWMHCSVTDKYRRIMLTVVTLSRHGMNTFHGTAVQLSKLSNWTRAWHVL
jgi:hypothetical protein